MKLYLSFGYVDESGSSTRLFHLEEPLDTAAVGKLAEFVKKNILDIFK